MNPIIQANHRALLESESTMRFCQSRGISLAAIRKFLLGIETRKISVLRNRLLFPMLNVAGEFLGYQGRIIDDNLIDKDNPKYWHQKFDKQSFLYGLYQNLELIQELDFVVLLEGNIDVLTLWQCGIPAIAKQGPHLSPIQASLIRRYTRIVVDWVDSDKAGEIASSNQRELLETFDFEVYKVKSKKYKDANELYLAQGAAAVIRLIDEI